MEALVALSIGMLVACGTWLLLRSRTFDLLLGLTLWTYAVNLFLLASGRLRVASAPLTDPVQAAYPDPLPQALVLTAIVISFGMTALLVVIALRSFRDSGSDHVDGGEA